MSSLTIDRVQKRFGKVEVLKDISISIDHGEFLVLVGPSGCGKSTLLNLIAGLETISDGEIKIGDRVVNNVAPKDRDIAMVFQSYALYPNMNIRKNISFGLETRKVPKKEIDEMVAKVSAMLQIESLLDRKPAQLSGGQRQRVAMGRALARNPSIFLFDEPLSNLDAKLRVEMRTEIKKLHHKIGTTIVYVTHDQIEAMTLADRIAIMKDGYLMQLGTPHEVYESPANLFVAGFIGSPSMNFVECTPQKANGGVVVPLTTNAGKTFELPLHTQKDALLPYCGKKVIAGIRPEHISCGLRQGNNGDTIEVIECRVDVLEPTGPDTLMFVGLNDSVVTSRVRPDEVKPVGEIKHLDVQMAKVHFFDAETEQRIG